MKIKAVKEKEIVAEYKIPLKLHKFQKEVLDNETRFKVLVWARQSGKTTLAVDYLIIKAVQKRGLYFYIAPTYKQAKMIAWEMLKFYCPKQIIFKINETELSLRLKNGSMIVLKGSDNKDSLRGVALDGVVFDEFQQQDMDVWNEIVKPELGVSKGWAMFIGTPFGKNHFFELYSLGKTDNLNWKSWKIDIWEIIKETGLIDRAWVEQTKKETPEKTFQQEFECYFHEDSGVVFRGIKACIKGHLKQPEQSHTYTLGADLAQAEDFTVITVLDNTSNEIVFFERFNQKDWNLVKAKIELASRKYNNAHCFIDASASGAGSPIVEDLSRQGISVEGFKFTNQSKRRVIENLMLLIEQQRISFPPLENLINELEIFSFEVSRSGNLIYNAPKGFHDDCVMSLGLACLNADAEPIGYPAGFYRPRHTYA